MRVRTSGDARAAAAAAAELGRSRGQWGLKVMALTEGREATAPALPAVAADASVGSSS